MNVAPRTYMEGKMSENETIFYRRDLPHVHPKGAIFFITFRLAGSIPVEVLQRLRRERECELQQLRKKYSGEEFDREKYKLEKRHFGRMDEWLDRASTGPHWLGEKRIARIVAERIHELDGKNYDLFAYSIMSNHAHLSFDTSEYGQTSATNIAGKTKDYPVADTMRLLKGSTSRFCNQELQRTGAFWHKESYDHYVRDDAELYRIIEYIVNNPVKARLVKHWQDWEFTYLKKDFID
jgi:REP element-mobilizing transposase RayT